MLEALGHTVTGAPDGRSAWDRLAQGGRFGLLLTDVCMPRLSGLELLADMRQACLGTPVVVMSGDHTNRALALRGGALAFLGKPFRLAELEAVVASALGT
jgi:DNA-binding NtrC family response regulator